MVPLISRVTVFFIVELGCDISEIEYHLNDLLNSGYKIHLIIVSQILLVHSSGEGLFLFSVSLTE